MCSLCSQVLSLEALKLKELFFELAGFIGIFVIPVAVTGRLFWLFLRVRSKEEVRFSLAEEVLASVTLGLGGVGLIALFLVECGIFNVISYFLVTIAINTLLFTFIIGQKTPITSLSSLDFKYLGACGAFLLLLILLVSLVLPPFEQVYGGRDGGEYINQAFWFAYKGSFGIEVPFVGILSDEAKDLFLFEFFRYEPAGWRFLYLYPGFYWVKDKNSLEFQFLHLYPSVLAPGMLASVKLSLNLTPALGLLGLIWLLVLGESVFERRFGLLAAFLWAINPLFIWFSRYANAELLMLVFVLAGIWGLVRSIERKGSFLKVFAFICFGLSSLTKIEALLILFPLIISCWSLAWGRKDLILFLMSFISLYTWSWLHLLVFSRHYFIMNLSIIATQMTRLTPLNMILYAGIILITILFFVLWKTKRTVRDLIEPAALVWAISGLIGYMMPAMFGLPAGLVPWGWFMSPVLVLLASVGPLIMAYDFKMRTDVNKLWVLLVFTGFFMILGIKFAMYGDYPWGARRTISGGMPLFTLIGSYPLFKGLQQSERLLKRGAVILIIAIMIVSLPIDLKFMKHKEYGKAIETLEKFDKIFPENSIIIFEGSLPGSWLSLPLAIQKGKLPLVFWLDQPSMPTVNLEAVREVAYKGESSGKSVYLVTTELRDLTALDCEFELIRSFDLEVPTFEFLNYGVPPLKNKIWEFRLYIYRIWGISCPN